MDILPLTAISDLDQELFGSEAINLAKLKRGGLPVLDGVVVNPPVEILNKITEILNQDSSYKKIDLAVNNFKDLKISQNIKKYFNKNNLFYFKGKLVKKDIWNELKISWWGEFITKYKNRQTDFNQIQLSDKIVFFLENKHTLFKKNYQIQSVSLVFDEVLGDFIPDSDKKINQDSLNKVYEVTRLAHKFLTLPFNFEIIIWNQHPFIVGVKPYTSPLKNRKIEKSQIKLTIKNTPKSAVKAYFNLPRISYKTFVSNLKTEEFESLNCIISGENFPNLDEKFEIVDYLNQNFYELHMIYKLPDILENNISGSLRLLHQPKLFEDSCNFVLFLRNKKNIKNIDIGIPHVRSVSELLKIKRGLAANGIYHKSGINIWLECVTPENLININKYLEAEVDGLIINLDKLEQLLIGFKIEEEKNELLAVDAILELLTKVFKSAHQLNKPIIVTGQNYITSGLLETFISWGVYGVLVNSVIEAQSLPYYLALLEKRLITERAKLPN